MTLDTTVGGSAADSYLSVAEADAMAEGHLSRFATLWRAAETTDEIKEHALRRATRDIDVHVSTTDVWLYTQSLLYPRDIDVDAASSPFLHPRVKEATFEQAIYRLANQKLMDDADSREARRLFNFDEDGISGSISLNNQVGRLSREAEAILGAITGGGLLSIPMRGELG